MKDFTLISVEINHYQMISKSFKANIYYEILTNESNLSFEKLLSFDRQL